MKIVYIIFLIIVLVFVALGVNSCNEYQMVSSAYVMGNHQVYRRDFRGTWNAWFELSDKRDFSGWLIRGRATGGVSNGCLTCYMVDKYDSVIFYLREGFLEITNKGDEYVSIREYDVRLPYPNYGVTEDSSVIKVSDCLRVDFNFCRNIDNSRLLGDPYCMVIYDTTTVGLWNRNGNTR